MEQARSRFDDVKAILNDPKHPRFEECYDALNFATIVKLADTFTDWAAMCRDERESTQDSES